MTCSTPRGRPGAALLAVWVAMMLGCGERTPRNDTAATPQPPPEASPPPTPRPPTWDPAAGEYFAVPGEGPTQAFLIDPAYDDQQALDTLQIDTSAARATEFELLVGSETTGRARLERFRPADSAACAVWPTAMATVPAARPDVAWRVAFPAGRVRGLAFDSLPALSARDSSRITIALARVASALPGDTATAFRGRPFVVRQANRFTLADGRLGVLAEITRSISQEANPLYEQIVLIAEGRDAPESSLVAGWHERRIGLEEDLEAIELVAPLWLPGAQRYAALTRREGDAGVAFELYERHAAAQWVRRWRSALAGC